MALWTAIVVACAFGGIVPAMADDEPALPAGLEDTGKRSAPSDEPDLPAGLGEPKEQREAEPGLPPGLEGDQPKPKAEPELPSGLLEGPTPSPTGEPKAKPFDLPFDVSGFWEIRGGLRTQHDPHERDASIGETRLQLELEKRLEWATF